MFAGRHDVDSVGTAIEGSRPPDVEAEADRGPHSPQEAKPRVCADVEVERGSAIAQADGLDAERREVETTAERQGDTPPRWRPTAAESSAGERGREIYVGCAHRGAQGGEAVEERDLDEGAALDRQPCAGEEEETELRQRAVGAGDRDPWGRTDFRGAGRCGLCGRLRVRVVDPTIVSAGAGSRLEPRVFGAKTMREGTEGTEGTGTEGADTGGKGTTSSTDTDSGTSGEGESCLDLGGIACESGCACEGLCFGVCNLEAAAHCEGVCMGICSGECEEFDDEGACAGACDGICEGSCVLEEGGACPGFCEGCCLMD